MERTSELVGAAGVALLLGAGSALAQETGAAATGDDSQLARQCIETLEALDQRMDEDGYWLTGWGSRWNYGYPPTDATVVTEPLDASPADIPTEEETVPAPWAGARIGILSPRHQIFSLRSSAIILAQRGNQEACSEVIAALEDVYASYIRELDTAGVDPGEVTTWRQERIVAAQPVTEINRVINAGDVTGTEIRNRQDEELGTVEDVVINRDGGIRYVIASSGGVFGIGEDEVAIPWNKLMATPGLNAFVLDVSEEVFEQAPTVNVDRFAQPDGSGQRSELVDRFWEEHLPG